MKPRLGLLSDVDAVTDVITKTMPLDPQWDYRFPWRLEYPDDHWKYNRMLIEYFLDPSYDDWVVMVIEDSIEPGSDDRQIVAFAVWEVSFVNKRIFGPGYRAQDPVTLVEERGGSTRRDANHERFNAFWKGQIKAYKRFFAPIGPDQIHLQILATLPDFQRRGHGSSLCKWGMELATKEGLKDISVMASPMGYELYLWLGWEVVGTFFIQVPGEEEKCKLEAMMYRPERKAGLYSERRGGCPV